MKKTLYTLGGVSIAATLLFSSCTKKIDEAFANPNASVRVPVETMLPGIIANMTSSFSTNGSAYGPCNDGLYTGRYVQFWATNTISNQYDQMGGATGASDVLGAVWAMHYFGMGQNINRMIDWATEDKKWDYVGVGYAIRAWSWLTLTNMHGEAILKEAFNAGQLVFNYDTQEDIYLEARRLCHVALEYLNKTGDGVDQANLAKGDAYLYNGDVNKWKKFVYSTLARTFNQLSNKATYNPDSVIIYANKGILTNADNALYRVAATGISATTNFYGSLRGNAGALRQTRFIADLLSGLNTRFLGVTDPRAPYLIRENTNGTYKGIRPNKGSDGLATADQPQNFWGGAFSSTTGSDGASRYIFQNAAPFPIFTASEVQFMLAEALFRKGQKEDARLAYIEGINQSFDFLTGTAAYHNSVPSAMRITPAAKAAYITNTTVVPASGNNLSLSHIMMQKYISMYGYGLIEVWVDMRRYHYTDLDPVLGTQVYADFVPPSGSDLYGNNNGKLVYRARPRYNSEYLYNVAALNSIGAIALDYNTKEMWYSQP